MVEQFDFHEEASKFTKNSVQLLKDSFGPNGLDCMISTTRGALLVTNNGHGVLKSLSVQSPVGRFLFRGLESFYNKTGDLSKKYFMLLQGLLHATYGQGRESLLQISLGMKDVLFQILPKMVVELKELVDIPIENEELKSIEKDIMCIIKTHFSGKFSPNTCEKLTSLIKGLLFKENSDVGILVGKVATLVDKFSEIFWEIPGSPFSLSTILPGILIPREFVTMVQKLPIEATEKPFKFILLGTSLGFEQPESETVLDLKDLVKAETFLAWRTSFVEKLFQKFSSLGIKLIISCKGLSRTVIHFCNQFKMAAIQYLHLEDMEKICNVFKIAPMFEVVLNDDLSPFTGEALHCKPVGIGQHTYVYLEASKASEQILGKQVLLYGPSEAMCRQYSVALQNALKTLQNSFTMNENGENMLSVVPGGGAFEFRLAYLLETYRKGKHTETSVETASSILEKALLSIPRQLVENASGQSSFCTIAAQARDSLKSGETFHGLCETGTLCNVYEIGIIEPLMGNYELVISVVQLFIQILRTDQIVHVKHLPKTMTYDSDSE